MRMHYHGAQPTLAVIAKNGHLEKQQLKWLRRVPLAVTRFIRSFVPEVSAAPKVKADAPKK